MPRYSKRDRKKKYKSLKDARHFARALGGLRDDDWRVFQKAAEDRTNHHRSVHAGAYKDLATGGRLDVLWAITEERKAHKRGQYVGGGLGDAFNSIFGSLYTVGIKPFETVYNGIANFTYPLLHDTTVSEHTQLVASAISQSYDTDEETRSDFVGDLVRDIDMSTNFLDVWVDNERHPPFALVSVRGSKTAEDFLVDDAAILVGGRTRDLIGADLSRAVEKYAAGHTVEVAGHSLGATLICQSFSNDPSLLGKVDRIDLFNPGTSPVNMNNVVSEYSQSDKFHFYENNGDLVGLGQMLYSAPPKNLVMKGIGSLNPADNHSIDQWLPETPFETGQLDESAKENLANPAAFVYEENTDVIDQNGSVPET
jgi:hypothetical protein